MIQKMLRNEPGRENNRQNMNLLKQVSRKIIFPYLMNLRVDKFFRKLTNNSILNIMYHGVVNKNSNYFSPRHITAEQFEEHLKYFSDEFDVIGISRAFEYAESNHKPERNTITISFDDGYRNNLYVALPLLKKYNIQTTFFISSMCTQEMDLRIWADIVACLDYFHKDDIIELDSKRFKNLVEIESKISLTDFLKTSDASSRDNYLDYLTLKYNIKKKLDSIPSEVWKLLTGEELKELSSSDIVEIGSHGHLHYNLAEVGAAVAKKELEYSKELLQNIVGKEINSVAYPDGSYNNETKNIAENLGYKYQLAVNYHCPDDTTDPRILNRHSISSTTTFESNMLLMNLAFKNKGF